MLKDKSMLKIDEKLNKNLLFQREYSVYHLEYEKENAHLHYYRNPINRSDRISYTTEFEDACCWG